MNLVGNTKVKLWKRSYRLKTNLRGTEVKFKILDKERGQTLVELTKQPREREWETVSGKCKNEAD